MTHLLDPRHPDTDVPAADLPTDLDFPADERRLQHLLEQWLRLEQQGQPALLEEVCADNPELLERFRHQVGEVRRLQRLLAPSRAIDPAPAANADPSITRSQHATDPWLGGPTPRPVAGTSEDRPTIGDYELLEELGRGGMGVVYKACQRKLNRIVALKMVLGGNCARPLDLLRFRSEAEAVARLQHPNIVQIFEIDANDGLPFFSLEFCDGGSLADRLDGTPWQPEQAAPLIETLARAIHVAHRAQVVHRDLKPQNVLLTSEGTVKITDFGLAKKLDETEGLTHSRAVLGTPSYMAPEQAAGRTMDVGPHSDTYALGAILYQLLTGRPPFKGTSPYDTLRQVTGTDPIPPTRFNPRCPRDLETICLKCLRKWPGSRYPTAEHLADDLRRFLDGRPIQARPVSQCERLLKWARRTPFQATTYAFGLGLVIAVMLVLAQWAYSANVEAQLQGRKLAEQKRLDDVRHRCTRLYTQAEQIARHAADAQSGNRADSTAWGQVKEAAKSALDSLAREPTLLDFPLREPLQKLLERAQGQLADVRHWEETRGRLPRFKEHYGAAVVFALDAAGLEVRDAPARAREAVAAALALFGVTTDNDGPLLADPRFFSAAEIRLLTDRCYEMLLLDAEILAREVTGEPIKHWHARLRQALSRLDRADRLLPGQAQPRSGLRRRADYLDKLKQVEAAAEARLAAESTPPRLAADSFQMALDHYHRDNFAAALGPLAAILREQPDHYGAEYLLAVCRLRENQFQPAYEGLSRCVEQRPGFAWPRLLRGFAAIQLKQWSEARSDFDEVLRSSPDVAVASAALVNRGYLALRQQDWSGAIADFRSAIAHQPRGFTAYRNLALCLRLRTEVPAWQQGALLLAPQGLVSQLLLEAHQCQACAEALGVLDEAARHCPPDARLHHERGQLHLLLGQHRQAREDFRQAVGLASKVGASSTLADDLIEWGRLLYRDREHEQAVRAYQQALKVRPDRAVAWRLLAQPLLALKRYEEAGAALDRYLATIPVVTGPAPTVEQAQMLSEVLKVRGLVHDEQARAFSTRALLHLRHKNLRAALDVYTQGLKWSRDPETLALRGWTYLMLDAPTLALPDFDDSLRLRPGYADALIGRANARVRLNQVLEAVKDAEEGVKRGPAEARLLYNAARVHAQAAAGLANPGQGRKPEPDTAAWCERRTAELLQHALERTPTTQRAAFWREYVQPDRAFDSVRAGSAMTALAKTILR